MWQFQSILEAIFMKLNSLFLTQLDEETLKDSA